MKKIGLLLVMIFAFCGCENGVDDDKVLQSQIERFSCKIDNELFIGDPDNFGTINVRIEYRLSDSSKSLYILAYRRNTLNGANTVKLNCDSVNQINYPYQIAEDASIRFENGNEFESAAGKIILTGLNDEYISGTFEFTAKEIGGTRSITVANGKFNARYIKK